MKQFKIRPIVFLAVRLTLLHKITASSNVAVNDTECSAYADLYKNIDEDLSIWQGTGISEQLTVQTIDRWTNRAQEKGFAVAYLDGVAYVIDFG